MSDPVKLRIETPSEEYRAYTIFATFEGEEMPLSAAHDMSQIRANEAYVAHLVDNKAHCARIRELAEREVSAMERIATALEKP